MDFTRIFEAAAIAPVEEYKGFVPYWKLESGQIYQLRNFRFMDAFNGRRCVAVTINNQDEWIVLPARLNMVVTSSEEISILNSMNYWMQFHGIISNTPILEFRKVTYSYNSCNQCNAFDYLLFNNNEN